MAHLPIYLWTLHIPPHFKAGDHPGLVAVLNPAEIGRFHKMGDEKRKSQFFLAHALLRAGLGPILGCTAGKVPLVVGRGEKPRLEGLSNPLYVSLSHCDDMIAAAAGSCAVGVDIETPEIERRFLEQTVHDFFSGAEEKDFASMKEDEKRIRFIQHWALKEALFKAADHPVPDIARKTSFAIDRSNGISFHSDLPGLEKENWQFRFLNPRPSRILALAVRSPKPVRIVEKQVSLDNLLQVSA